MGIIAIVSGLLNLTSQVVYQKVVSLLAGDLYSTFLLVTLTFILGSAVGSYLGPQLRRYLPWIEFGAGAYALLLRVLLEGEFYNWILPQWVVFLGLVLPALALGTHLPLYANYLRSLSFGSIYALYHLGAVVGLLAIEYYYSTAGSVKSSLLVLGGSQLMFGLFLIWQQKQATTKLEQTSARVKMSLRGAWSSSTLAVAAASFVSFYVVFWALKSQVMLTEGFRLQATAVSAAVFAWMAIAGPLYRLLKLLKIEKQISLGMPVLLLVTLFLFPFFNLQILALNDGSLLRYFGLSFILALSLTPVVLASALIFIQSVDQEVVTTQQARDQVSARLGMIAALANLGGMIAGAALAAEIWFAAYWILPLGIGFVLWIYATSVGLKQASVALILLVALATWLLQTPQRDFLFLGRLDSSARDAMRIENPVVLSSPFSSVGLYSTKFVSHGNFIANEDFKDRVYLVDGHLSHDMYSGMEFAAGLAVARFIDQRLARSLVIGVGSGQAVRAVAALSEQTDMVEISPVVLQRLAYFRQLNDNLDQHPRVTSYIEDGFDFLKRCNPGSYDFVFNTATYPANFNAAKLYSAEFVAKIKSCLKPRGYYQTYVDFNTARDFAEMQVFLAPLFSAFKYVSVVTHPYPQVIATDFPLAVKPLRTEVFVEPELWGQWQKQYPQYMQNKCSRMKLNMQASLPLAPMSTLDRSYLEAISLKNSVWSLYRFEEDEDASFDRLVVSEKNEYLPCQ